MPNASRTALVGWARGYLRMRLVQRLPHYPSLSRHGEHVNPLKWQLGGRDKDRHGCTAVLVASTRPIPRSTFNHNNARRPFRWAKATLTCRRALPGSRAAASTRALCHSEGAGHILSDFEKTTMLALVSDQIGR
jgi:hypothetical protein